MGFPKLKIGNIEIDGAMSLGPMAGVTDLPFRIICKEMGVGLLCTEMVSAKALYYGSEKTKDLMKRLPGESPLAIQLFGSEPEILADMAGRIEDNFDFIDFNMGCPMPKVVNNGEGSALMKEPKKVENILTAMVKKLHTPVTLKIRAGFDEDHINAVEIAKIAESCGVAGIAVHARTRQQYYTGRANWHVIRDVKNAVNIPVIGNGDITSAPLAKAMLDETGCDGFMIARGALGNPWIFREIKHFFETGNLLPHPTPKEKVEMILRHTRLQIQNEGEWMGIRQMRKHIAWYTHGLKGSSSLRDRVNHVERFSELEDLLQSLLI